MSTRRLPSDIIRSRFPFQPTPGQQRFFQKMNQFFADPHGKVFDCFILKGYAGTGKTTLVSALVKSAAEMGFRSVLMAPTGRAAKVMSGYSGRKAFTIHRKIYRQPSPESAGFNFIRQPNYHGKTLFVIDEASMISDESSFGANGVLSDLIEYIFEGPGNKVFFVGDTAQLPPVGTLLSPALDPVFLEKRYGINALEEELTDVMRQAESSGILWNATSLRSSLMENRLEVQINTRSFRDVYRMTGARLEEGLRYAYDKFGEENTIVLTRSNKAAVQYNQYIRRIIRFADEEIDAGERLMVVRNNYRVLAEDSGAGFLANGDFVELLKVKRLEEMHGFRFADVTLRLSDYPNEPAFDTRIILDTLYSASPALTQEEHRKLYESVMLDYADLRTKKERLEAMRKDPYLNAVQVKFAYALTCHKAQGGQWEAVFVDQGFIPDQQVSTEFLRWIYTAVTRATRELYLMNFHESFFQGSPVTAYDE